MSVDDWSFRTAATDQARESWGRMLSTTHLPWDVRELCPDPQTGFAASVRRRHLADLVLVDCSCDPCSGVRRPYEISQTDGEYLVMLMTLSGRELVAQADQQSQLSPGSVVVWDSRTPAEFIVQEPLVKRSLLVPRAALGEIGTRGELMTGAVLDADAPAVGLLRCYLDGLSRTIDDLPLGAHPAARNATIELLAAALQSPVIARPISAVATRGAAEAFIERNLRERRLSPSVVAQGIGVSVRSLHRAFEDTGDTVAAFIRRLRLARARDDLMSGVPVSQVGRRWHYSDASHFSRSFKRHYGRSPSELIPTP
ncbi:helix-turn-helix domain-containing protein [Xylanimonas allomyrinae]|uniref:Helix-turn-helix domain-containing protein n=1 Tax=Xylanimonas allomyrinae TaxID=2509459 RepID=A0A4P6EP15_9MICO|nr:helix-turn-helix domain-containing protein [Xylanimonas allomyrinae]QAY64196.1 helix-turn-helix domain-containing protein [Xylanimonas allomyrinae]